MGWLPHTCKGVPLLVRTKGLDKTNCCCTFALSKWCGSDSTQRTKMYLGTNLS